MSLSLRHLAQGEVKNFPHRSEIKWKIHSHRLREPLFRFTLVSNKGVEQEVEFVEEGPAQGALKNGGWYTTFVVCPADTLDTKGGLRLIQIDVDASERATYV